MPRLCKKQTRSQLGARENTIQRINKYGMSDPLSLHMLAKGDTVAEGDDTGPQGTVIDILPFKKPIYDVKLASGEIVHIRASMTKKGRAGKQFVRVSKEDGGRWAMVPETLLFVSVRNGVAVPATPEEQLGAGTKSSDNPNPYCKCEDTHAVNEQCDKE